MFFSSYLVSFEYLIIRHSYLAIWYRLRRRINSVDLPENMGPKMTCKLFLKISK